MVRSWRRRSTRLTCSTWTSTHSSVGVLCTSFRWEMCPMCIVHIWKLVISKANATLILLPQKDNTEIGNTKGKESDICMVGPGWELHLSAFCLCYLLWFLRCHWITSDVWCSTFQALSCFDMSTFFLIHSNIYCMSSILEYSTCGYFQHSRTACLCSTCWDRVQKCSDYWCVWQATDRWSRASRVTWRGVRKSLS